MKLQFRKASTTARELRARSSGVELRTVTDEEKADGYIGALVGNIPFNSDSQQLRDRGLNKGQPFIERLAPDAFKRSLEEDKDQMGFAGHTDDPLAAFARAGSNLALTVDDNGLQWRALLPDTQSGRDLKTLTEQRIITGTSFEFTVEDNGEKWEKRDGKDVRTITAARLYTVNPVAFPAYPESELTAERSANPLASRRGVYVYADEWSDPTLTCDTAFAINMLGQELGELTMALEYLRCAGAAGGKLADYAKAEVTESAAAVKTLVDFLAASGAEINPELAGRAQTTITEARQTAGEPVPISQPDDVRERRRRALSVSPVSPLNA